MVAAAAALSLGVIALETKADAADFECDGECEFDEGAPRWLFRPSNNWHYALTGLASGDSPGTWHCYETDDGPPPVWLTLY